MIAVAHSGERKIRREGEKRVYLLIDCLNDCLLPFSVDHLIIYGFENSTAALVINVVCVQFTLWFSFSGKASFDIRVSNFTIGAIYPSLIFFTLWGIQSYVLNLILTLLNTYAIQKNADMNL